MTLTFRIITDNEDAYLEVLDPLIPKWFRLVKGKAIDPRDRNKKNVYDKFSFFVRMGSYRDEEKREVVLIHGETAYNYKIIQKIQSRIDEVS